MLLTTLVGFAHRAKLAWINHPGFDWFVVILLLACELLLGAELAHGLDEAGRFTWYMALTTVFGSLAGFTVAANAVVLVLTPSQTLHEVFRQVGMRLQKLLLSSMLVLAVIAIGMALAIPLDSWLGPVWMGVYVVGLLVIGALRLLRYMWLFDRVLSVRRTASIEQEWPSGDAWRAPEISDTDYMIEAHEQS